MNELEKKKAKKIFVGNYKGGVAKTTTVFEIGLILSEIYDKKVLLIDLDSQCSLSRICCKDKENQIDETLNYILDIYYEYMKEISRLDILKNKVDIGYDVKGKCIKEYKPNLDYIATVLDVKNSRLNDIAEKMGEDKKNVIAVAKLIESIEEEYDYIFFDCPPTSNILTQGIFLYSDYYLIPTIADKISTDGVPDYITEIEGTYFKYAYAEEVGGTIVKQYFGDKPKLIGVLITLFKDIGNRKPNDFDEIKILNKAIDELKIKTLIGQTDEGLNGNKNIFEKVVKHRDNRTDPNNYGLPKTISNGEIHKEYEEVVKALLTVLGDEDE